MKCPTCSDTSLVMSERSGIEIDYCPTCRGVWLDRGELDKIIEKSQSQKIETTVGVREKVQEVLHRDDHAYRNEQYYKHKKKKSFLEELFD
jgi:Zn-finger nucleic acid-binding protein